MRLLINLKHLETKELHLSGEFPLEDLDLDIRDELQHVDKPLVYDLVVEQQAKDILVNGSLELPIQCECIRCLKLFPTSVHLEKWTCNLSLEGDDRVPVENDFVDLTPYVRDDILLEFPQHPLCDKECGGLPKAELQKRNHGGDDLMDSSEWAKLDKLKF